MCPCLDSLCCISVFHPWIGLGSTVAVTNLVFLAPITGHLPFVLGGFLLAFEAGFAISLIDGVVTHGTELSGRKPSKSGIVGDLDAISLTKSRSSFNSGPKPLSGFLEAGSPLSILLPSLINRSRGPWGSDFVSGYLG